MEQTTSNLNWETLPYALPVLLLWPLLLFLVRLRSGDGEKWNTPLDLGIALGLGALTMALKAWVLVPDMWQDEVTGSDVPGVCAIVSFLVDGTPELLRRPGFGALPAALLTPALGMRDAIFANSMIFPALQGAAIYVWARALFNREAGVAAVMLSCAVAQLATMPRVFSFFPSSAGLYTMAAAATAVALRWPGKVSLAIAGAGLGMALLADHPGLIYATPMLALCLVLCRVKGRRRETGKRLAALLLPICLSWGVGHILTPLSLASFEDKMSIYIGTYEAKGESRPKEVPRSRWLKRWALNLDVDQDMDKPTPGYRWGHSGPLQITKTLTALSVLALEDRPPSQDESFIEESAVIREGLLEPWLPAFLLGLGVCLVAGLRRARTRWRLLGAAFIFLPFGALLYSHLKTELYLRFMLAPLAALPVLLGVALAVLIQRSERRAWLARFRRLSEGARLLLVVGSAALLILGIVPSWLSQEAPWRGTEIKINHDIKWIQRVALHRLREPKYPLPLTDQNGECVDPFLADFKRGIPRKSRLYPDAFSGCIEDPVTRKRTHCP